MLIDYSKATINLVTHEKFTKIMLKLDEGSITKELMLPFSYAE